MRLMELIFPERCLLCDKVIPKNKYGTCDDCRKDFPFVKEPSCKRCGKQLGDVQAEYCSDCKERRHYFEQGVSLCRYEGKLKGSIYRLKYKNRQRYGDYYGQMIAERLGRYIVAWKPDAIIPVPLHKDKLAYRGYNQAALISKSIGKYLSIPVCENIIFRVKNTEPLKLLNPSERQNNLKKAFKTCRNNVKLETVVIVDDIYTTGSTIDELSLTLKRAGVKRVYFVALASGSEND